MSIQQFCNNNSNLLVFLIIAVVFVIFVWLIVRNVRKFQQDVSEWGKRASFGNQQFALGHDGEIEVIGDNDSVEHNGRKKKKDYPPNTWGCLIQQFVLALVGLITAIISFLAVSNPLVTINFESACYNIFNLNPTPIAGLSTNTATLEPTDLFTDEPFATPTNTATITLTLIPTESETAVFPTQVPIPSLVPIDTLECDLETPLTPYNSEQIIPDWTNNQVSQVNVIIPKGYDTVYISSDPAVFNGFRSRERLIILSQTNLVVDGLTFNDIDNDPDPGDGHFNIWAMAFSNCDLQAILDRYGLDNTNLVWLIDEQGDKSQIYP
jgi:hypothetical protein